MRYTRYDPEVFSAAGMVSVQANCLIEEALAMMSDRATVAHVTLDEIAAAATQTDDGRSLSGASTPSVAPLPAPLEVRYTR